ncbi:MAG: glycogen debranching protein GlgX [Burkholderiaceae bacterium]
MRMWAGRPYPLGATFDGRGVNFALFSAHASAVQLCLYEESGRREVARFELPEMTDEIWHGYLPDAVPGLLYGYRVHGPYDPAAGHRFNPHKLLIDPYAKLLHGQVRWSNAHFGYRVGSGREDLSFDRADNGSGMIKGVVVDPAFDWRRNPRPGIRADESILYEAHVKGLTALHPQVPARQRGTFAGLSHAAVIDHLVGLGITAIELLPVHAFIDDRHLTQRGLSNYWGYNSIGFFAPEQRYLSADGGLTEFQIMVARLHAAGIEVILDVVFNHTAEGNHLGPTLSFKGIDNASYYRLSHENPRYYVDYTGCGNTLDLSHPRVLQLVLDSLRYWVGTMGVDGFRFDLATTLGRGEEAWSLASPFLTAIRQDPVLQTVKLIAEPWDVGPDGYRLGQHGPGFSEWNDRYRDAVRAFWRGDEATTAEFSTRLLGSADLFEQRGRRPWASVNFVTAHDGFCLHDVVSYNDKHNEANLEDNRDGHDHNLSCNYGAEGPTDDREIIEMRGLQKRNLLATLLLSQGMPMLLAGDEIGHSQQGNNNAYCQDNPLTWIDWQSIDSEGRELAAFVEELIRLRRAHPVFRRASFLHGQERSAQGTPDILWLRAEGGVMDTQAWQDPARRAFGMMLTGHAGVHLPPEGPPEDDETFLLLFNGGAESVEFTMPGQSISDGWQRVLDTSEPTLRTGARLWREIECFHLPGRSLSVFRAGRRSRAAGVRHTMPFGAEVLEGGVTRFRLWAPAVSSPHLLLGNGNGDGSRALPMLPVGDSGWFEVVTDAAGPGSRYRYRVDDDTPVPDPASRAQQDGPHGYSLVVDPSDYRWRDSGWQGLPWEQTVILEVHVGTFSRSGTFDGVRARLPALAEQGITAIELMPIGAFAGERNWGYDGVLPFAPHHGYGIPAALKAMVDEAHRLGIQVFLDVVYNHFGPEGNYLMRYAPQFYRRDSETPWGAALDFENALVRSFFVHNALFWLTEYRLDGLRFDAVHAIPADGRSTFLHELGFAVRQRFGHSRHVHLIVENEENDAGLLREEYTAQWNDDIHHCLHVLLTGEQDGYYADYADDTMAMLLTGLAEGFVYQGQAMRYRDGRPRGSDSSALPPQRFVAFLQNHDQVGNRAFGERIGALASAEAVCAAQAVVLLAPQIPMLFMGEELGSRAPFQFFTDFGGELGQAVRDGRRREFARFGAFAGEPASIPDPESPETFERSHVETSVDEFDESERDRARAVSEHIATLIRTRQRELVPLLSPAGSASARRRTIGERGFEISWRLASGATWVLIGVLGDQPISGFQRPAGELVFASRPTDTGDLARGELAAWTVLAFRSGRSTESGNDD